MNTIEVKCCGQTVYCYNFTNTCEICGTDYNWEGVRLAPRECWGEETGEHWSDIVNGNFDETDEIY
jgi:hypothetical protein